MEVRLLAAVRFVRAVLAVASPRSRLYARTARTRIVAVVYDHLFGKMSYYFTACSKCVPGVAPV